MCGSCAAGFLLFLVLRGCLARMDGCACAVDGCWHIMSLEWSLPGCRMRPATYPGGCPSVVLCQSSLVFSGGSMTSLHHFLLRPSSTLCPGEIPSSSLSPEDRSYCIAPSSPEPYLGHLSWALFPGLWPCAGFFVCWRDMGHARDAGCAMI